MPTRPKLTKITLTYEVDGQTRTHDVDPSTCTALFWHDHSVEHLLASYYDPRHPGQPKNPAMSTAKVMSDWNTPKADGTMPMVMSKVPASTSEVLI